MKSKENFIHICKNYYANAEDKYNWILYSKEKVTEKIYEKMSVNQKELYKVGDFYYRNMEKYYPTLEDLVEILWKHYSKELGKQEIEIKDYILQLKELSNSTIKEMKKIVKENNDINNFD